MSIAVFDSGVGGISVLKSLVEVMPNEDFIYYGDSANAPYGTKTLEQVRALTCEHAKELILNQHAKGIVVACNTATSAAVRILREQYPDVLFIVMWQRPFTVFTYFCVVVKKTFRIIHRCLLKLVLFIIS